MNDSVANPGGREDWFRSRPTTSKFSISLTNHKHSPLTFNGLLTYNSYSRSITVYLVPLVWQPKADVGCPDRSPPYDLLSINKPGWVRGKPAPAAPSPLDRTAHLVYMLVTLRAFPLDYLSGKLSKPFLLSNILLIYNSDLRVVVSRTQDFVRILEQHNNSLWQTLQNNRISSLFSHRTNSKVLLLPFIHYRIDLTSTSVVIYNIYFSVGIS